MKLNRIQFEDKDSNTVKSNSKYVITKEQVNEIKDVINKLIFIAEMTVFNFNEVTRYLNIKLPENYMVIGKKYFIELELSKNKDFSNSKRKNSRYECGFLILKNGSYVETDSVNYGNAGETLLVDLSDLVEENVKKYFIRYRIFSSELVANNGVYRDEEYSKYLGSEIGAIGISPNLSDTTNEVYKKNNNTSFIYDVNDLIYNLNTIYVNDVLSGSISVSAEYSNGEIKSISNFELVSLDTDLHKLTQSSNTFTIDNLNENIKKYIGISYIGENNKRFVKPIEISLSGSKDLYDYTFPNRLNYSTSAEYKILKNNVDISNTSSLIIEDLLTSNGKVSNTNAYNDVHYKSISHLEKETLVRCPSLKLDYVFINDENGNELTELDIGQSYSYSLAARFIEDNSSFIIPIEKKDVIYIRFSGFKDWMSYDENYITTDYTKRVCIGLVDISFKYKNNVFVFQRQMLLRGHLTAKVSGILLCSDDSNLIEYPVSSSFLISELEGEDNEIYTRNISLGTNFDLHDKFFIGIKDFGYDQNISGVFPITAEFTTNTQNTYSLSLNKFNDNILVSENQGAFQKASKISHLTFKIKFKGTDVLA